MCALPSLVESSLENCVGLLACNSPGHIGWCLTCGDEHSVLDYAVKGGLGQLLSCLGRGSLPKSEGIN
eukprot:2518429-Alexandrium_andersonii.AAC.1